MDQSPRIVLVVSPAAIRSPAFEHACHLAAAGKLPLHLLLLVRSRMIAAACRVFPRAGARAREGYLEGLRRLLEQETAALRACGITAGFTLAWSARPSRDLLAALDGLTPQLVVKDAAPDYADRDCERALLRHSRAPLLLVKSGTDLVRRIAVAIDTHRAWPADAAFNHRLLREGQRLARVYGAELHLVQAQRPRSTPGGVFDDLADAYGIPQQRRHRLSGRAVAAIGDFLAEHSVDLLIAGAPLRPTLHRLLSGNHAEGLQRAAVCDTLALRF